LFKIMLKQKFNKNVQVRKLKNTRSKNKNKVQNNVLLAR